MIPWNYRRVFRRLVTRFGLPIVAATTRHVCGKKVISYEKDECIVVSLVFNASLWLREFIEHYSKLGVVHIVLLDNGSTDDTLRIASAHDRVSVFRCRLPYRTWQIAMRIYLLKRFCNNRWALIVDSDEFFDFPNSDRVSLPQFLAYLDSKKVTAVLGHLLDMFPDIDVSRDSDPTGFRKKYRFYDISEIDRAPYPKGGNVITNEQLECFSGGIRRRVFGISGVLRKHPLVFVDSKLKWDVHVVKGATIADVSTVLYHYKLLDLHSQMAARKERRCEASTPYLKYIEGNPVIRFFSERAKELGTVTDLLESGFVVSTPAFDDYARSQKGNAKLEIGRNMKV